MIEVRTGGISRKFPLGCTYRDIARACQPDQMKEIVLVLVDGRLQELQRPAKKDCTLEWVTLSDRAGFNAYRRSMTLLMLKAFYHVCGRENLDKIGIHFVVSDGYYCTLEGRQELTQGLLDQVKAYMAGLVEKALPIEKHNVGITEAIEKFQHYGMYDKAQLFQYRRVSRVNLYRLDGFEDYFYGYMVPDTSYLACFDLVLFADGFVLRMPKRGETEKLPAFAPRQKIFRVQKDSLEWGRQLNIRDVGDLNDQIVYADIKELILIQEAMHEKKMAEMAEEIASDPRRKLVMIAGPSSSGKTTFSHRLSAQLAVYGLKPHPIGVDDYFVNRELTPLDEEGKPNYECLEAIDVEQFNRDMTALLAGERVELPSFNFKTGKREYRGKFVELGSNDILVIEGIHCLNDKLSHSLPRENKYKIYISALTQLSIDEHNRIPTTDGRLLRRIVRDARTRGTNAQNTIAMWDSVRRGEENYIFPYQEEADVMFNSALVYELACLKLYAEPLLFGIGKDEPEYIEAKRLLKFFDYFVAVPSDDIPRNSLLREFVGGSCFDV